MLIFLRPVTVDYGIECQFVINAHYGTFFDNQLKQTFKKLFKYGYRQDQCFR